MYAGRVGFSKGKTLTRPETSLGFFGKTQTRPELKKTSLKPAPSGSGQVRSPPGWVLLPFLSNLLSWLKTYVSLCVINGIIIPLLPHQNSNASTMTKFTRLHKKLCR